MTPLLALDKMNRFSHRFLRQYYNDSNAMRGRNLRTAKAIGTAASTTICLIGTAYAMSLPSSSSTTTTTPPTTKATKVRHGIKQHSFSNRLATVSTTTVVSCTTSYNDIYSFLTAPSSSCVCEPLLEHHHQQQQQEDEDIDEGAFSEVARFQQCLEYHKSLLDEYRLRWDHQNSRTPTTTGWPKNIPTVPQEISMLEYDFQYASGSYRDDLQFRLAVYYLEYGNDPARGFALLQDLAMRQDPHPHADAMCMMGILWNEGKYREAKPNVACMWFRRAADLGHAQACYEMGVALYTGEGVAEDETAAVAFFEKAAFMGHAAAAYMLGDCLLDGVGVERDRAEALEWIVAAGEMGHRGARSRVLAVLEKEESADYGEFTDASRQTFKRRPTFKRKVEDGEVEEKKWSEEDVKRLVTIERTFTIGGGSRNPVVLARRKSVVDESREMDEESTFDESQGEPQ